jgi:hypothetical protein
MLQDALLYHSLPFSNQWVTARGTGGLAGLWLPLDEGVARLGTALTGASQQRQHTRRFHFTILFLFPKSPAAMSGTGGVGHGWSFLGRWRIEIGFNVAQ